jgi:multiple sugar transport system ATP-binding protein
MTLASRIAVMHQGSIQQFAEPRTTYERPASMFVAGFMGSPPMNFIPARLAAGGSRPEVLIESDGRELRLPVPHADAALRAWRGRELVLGVRPENITHHGRRAFDGADAIGELEAEVEVVEPTGAETMVVIRLGGREVIARVDPDEAQPAGSLMRFAVDMRKACLFDPASERLI